MPSSLTGSPQTAGQDLYTTSATQYHRLGERLKTPDGREFRYCLAGATTLVVGKLQQAAAEKTNHQNLTPTAAAIGATSVTVTLGATASTANQYADGWAIVTVTPDVGQQYRIKSHAAAASSAAQTLTLDDPLVAAWTSSTRVDMVLNPYSGVVVNPTTATSCPVGAGVFAITNAQYGWIQTKGVAALLADVAITVGVNVSASNAIAGAVEAAVTAQAACGFAVTGIADTEYGAIFLTLP